MHPNLIWLDVLVGFLFSIYITSILLLFLVPDNCLECHMFWGIWWRQPRVVVKRRRRRRAHQKLFSIQAFPLLCLSFFMHIWTVAIFIRNQYWCLRITMTLLCLHIFISLQLFLSKGLADEPWQGYKSLKLLAHSNLWQTGSPCCCHQNHNQDYHSLISSAPLPP